MRKVRQSIQLNICSLLSIVNAKHDFKRYGTRHPVFLNGICPSIPNEIHIPIPTETTPSCSAEQALHTPSIPAPCLNTLTEERSVVHQFLRHASYINARSAKTPLASLGRWLHEVEQDHLGRHSCREEGESQTSTEGEQKILRFTKLGKGRAYHGIYIKQVKY